jgi:hypothetical protein
MAYLTVRQMFDFGTVRYRRGDLITDPATVSALLRSHHRTSVIKVPERAHVEGFVPNAGQELPQGEPAQGEPAQGEESAQ